jgi:hypothetical protein
MGPSIVLSFTDLGVTPVLVRTGHCILTGVVSANDTAGEAFVQCFDAARVEEVTMGTTRATWVIGAKANDISLPHNLPSGGVVFGRGLVIASTNSKGGAQGATQQVKVCLLG